MRNGGQRLGALASYLLGNPVRGLICLPA